MEARLNELRLLTRVTTHGTMASVSRIANSVVSFLQNPKDLNLLELALREIDFYDSDMNSIFASVRASDAEVLDYENIRAELEAKISETENQIKQLEIELSEEILIRRHKDACETFATTVASHSNRKLLASQMRQALEDLESAKEELIQTERDIARRQQQFNELLRCVDMLKNKLDEDSKLENVEDNEVEMDVE